SEAAENVVATQPKSVNSEPSAEAVSSKPLPPSTDAPPPPDILRAKEPPQPDKETKPPAASGWISTESDKAPGKEQVERTAALKVVIGTNASGQNTFANVLNQFAAPSTEVM